MENIKELLENFKNEIINELPKAIVNVMEMEISFDDEIEDAVINAVQGIKDDESAKDRLYVLSQDKKLLAPLFSAEVHSANSKNPKSKDFPFVITIRSGVTSNNVFGWYNDEESAKAELQNIYKAIKFAEKNQYAVYEMK